MRIVLAPDSFKESMSARAAAAAMERGVRAVLPDAECVAVPMADGGEGTVDALVGALGARRVHAEVTGPLGGRVVAEYGWVADRRLAVIEAAAAVGVGLVPAAHRDVLRADSRGLGELVRHALDAGAQRLMIGLGGTVTNDGGAGMLHALGARLLDDEGDDVAPGPAGLEALVRLDGSALDRRLAGTEMVLATDVTNPMLGLEGASAVFGPQKGASPQDVPRLDAALGRFAAHLAVLAGRDVAPLPGAGAAGGIGAALLACAPAVVRPGAEVVLQAVGLPRALVGADLVLTGEGSVDAQTLRGKVPFAVARVAARAGVPVVVLGGRVGPVAEELLAHGVLAVVPIVRGVGDLAAALREGPANLEAAAATVLRLVVGRAGPPQRPGGPVASLDVPSEGREESTVTEDRELPQPPSNPPDAVTDADIDEIEAETQEGADPPYTARHGVGMAPEEGAADDPASYLAP